MHQYCHEYDKEIWRERTSLSDSGVLFVLRSGFGRFDNGESGVFVNVFDDVQVFVREAKPF